MVHKVVMLRHGESAWNNDRVNKFCGWYDADLSEEGAAEAINAGNILKENGFEFDVAFTSVLKRAIKTLFYIQDILDSHWIPVYRHWRLNERMYGSLQGLNKSETAQKYGEAQVKIWRRSYDVCPPPIDESSPYYPHGDPKYKYVDPNILPTTESLKTTMARVLPYWTDVILPHVKRGDRVLISAHGTTVRALVKHLDGISDNDIVASDIPTGIPLVYELDDNFKTIKHYYLATDEQVKAAMDRIANQGKIRKEFLKRTD